MNIINPSGSKTITLAANETLDVWIEDFDSGNRSFECVILHTGENTQCTVQGRIQTRSHEIKKWKISHIYTGKNQKGILDLRGAAEDKSRIEIDGSAIIQSSAKNSTAHVYERIMLFDQAQGYLLPVLTVQTENVESASHSGSVAPVEPEKILYLQSRGFSQKQAEQKIKEGFLERFDKKEHIL